MIYVDDLTACIPNKKWRYEWSCHLFSDSSVEELHKFAKKLGLRKSWFQDSTLPHYDLTKNKRGVAMRAGATPCSRQKLIGTLLAFQKKKLDAGYCLKREDEQHCVHWWDGGKCCSCGHGE